MKIYLSLIIFFLVSCSTYKSAVLVNNKIDRVYNPAGSAQYLLPELPQWANFSVGGRCFRTESIRYIDFFKLSHSYNFKYDELIHFQAIYNSKMRDYKNGNIFKKLTGPRDEEVLFFDVVDSIKGGIKKNVVPDYNIVNLILLDGLIENEEKFKAFLNSNAMDLGHPVFISLCLSLEEIEKIIEDYKLSDRAINILSAEFFASFNENADRIPYFYLNFSQFFREDQILNLYYALDEVPFEFGGNFSIYKI